MIEHSCLLLQMTVYHLVRDALVAVVSQRETKGVEHEQVPVESQLILAVTDGYRVGRVIHLVPPHLFEQHGVGVELLLSAGTGIELLMAGTGAEDG